MYFALAKKNLKTQLVRSVMTATGIALAIAAVTVLTALNSGMRKAIYDAVVGKTPLTQIVVQSKSHEGVFNIFSVGQNGGLTRLDFERVAKLEHVVKAMPEMAYINLSSLRLGIFGQTLQTDTMIFGVPKEFIEEVDTDGTLTKKWDEPVSPYPVVISQNILDLYNFTVAPTNRLPTFKSGDVIGKELDILPGVSTFFPTSPVTVSPFKGKIEKFSSRVDLVGITMPIDIVRQLNEYADPDYQDRYVKVHLEIDNATHLEEVMTKIQDLGLNATSPRTEVEAVESNFRIISMGLSIITLIILIISGLTIANTFFSSVNERQHEIGLLRALGATRGDIQKMFLAEASYMGIIGGFFGIVSGVIAAMIFDRFAINAIPELTLKPHSLLQLDPTTFFFTLLFAIALSVVFAFFPSTRAARMEPLDALNHG